MKKIQTRKRSKWNLKGQNKKKGPNQVEKFNYKTKKEKNQEKKYQNRRKMKWKQTQKKSKSSGKKGVRQR